jgi:hypothetical protein
LQIKLGANLAIWFVDNNDIIIIPKFREKGNTNTNTKPPHKKEINIII